MWRKRSPSHWGITWIEDGIDPSLMATWVFFQLENHSAERGRAAILCHPSRCVTTVQVFQRVDRRWNQPTRPRRRGHHQHRPIKSADTLEFFQGELGSYVSCRSVRDPHKRGAGRHVVSTRKRGDTLLGRASTRKCLPRRPIEFQDTNELSLPQNSGSVGCSDSVLLRNIDGGKKNYRPNPTIGKQRESLSFHQRRDVNLSRINPSAERNPCRENAHSTLARNKATKRETVYSEITGSTANASAIAGHSKTSTPNSTSTISINFQIEFCDKVIAPNNARQ